MSQQVKTLHVCMWPHIYIIRRAWQKLKKPALLTYSSKFCRETNEDIFLYWPTVHNNLDLTWLKTHTTITENTDSVLHIHIHASLVALATSSLISCIYQHTARPLLQLRNKMTINSFKSTAVHRILCTFATAARLIYTYAACWTHNHKTLSIRMRRHRTPMAFRGLKWQCVGFEDVVWCWRCWSRTEWQWQWILLLVFTQKPACN